MKNSRRKRSGNDIIMITLCRSNDDGNTNTPVDKDKRMRSHHSHSYSNYPFILFYRSSAIILHRRKNHSTRNKIRIDRRALVLIIAALLVLSNLMVHEKNDVIFVLQKKNNLLKDTLDAAKVREKEQSGNMIRISKLEKELASLEIEKSKATAANKERVADLEEQVLLLQNKIESGSYLVREDKNHDHLITPPSTTIEAEQKTENCVRLSTQAMGHAKFRIVVYQKQGGQQLIDLITHYIQALTYDEIVVVANEDGNNILEETPMYNELISKGIHFWQCIGTHGDKGDRWTQVVKQYKDTSDFIQPTDVDEYLALLSPTNSTSLLWDRTSLHTALDELPLSDGKPYKTLDSKPVPGDCKFAWEKKSTALDLAKYQSRHCRLSGFTEPRLKGCYNKVFFRGSEFTETDTGNHFGSNNFLRACEKEGVEAGFQPTSFVLIHYQTLDFNDWLTHALRMATDENFNRFDIDKCPEGHDQPWHECVIFSEMAALDFNLYEVRALYQKRMCNVGAYLDVAGVTKICTS